MPFLEPDTRYEECKLDSMEEHQRTAIYSYFMSNIILLLILNHNHNHCNIILLIILNHNQNHCNIILLLILNHNHHHCNIILLTILNHNDNHCTQLTWYFNCFLLLNTCHLINTQWIKLIHGWPPCLLTYKLIRIKVYSQTRVQSKKWTYTYTHILSSTH
jgi:hypothetical protein